MKTLTKLTATCFETDFREPPIHHQTISETAHVGAIPTRGMRIGPAGIVVTNGNEEVAIPAAEIYALVEAHEPCLALQNKR